MATAAFNRQEYVCDCGRKCTSRIELNEHQVNSCRNAELQCSFCQQTQPSTRDLREHLMMCGNKTDQCPNCQKFIRRAVFAYHYENDCANLDEPETPALPARISSAHRPSSSISRSAPKNDHFIDDDQENNSDSISQRISSSRSRNKSPSDIKQCRYCTQRCLRSDYDAHKKKCLQNPKNLNRDQPRVPFASAKPESRSNDIVKIPCDLCNEQIDLNAWSTHSDECRRREKRRLEARAKTINDEPVVEQMACEHCKELFSLYRHSIHEAVCRKNPEYITRLARPVYTQPTTTPILFNGLTNTQRDPTLSSTYSSLPSSYASSYDRPSPAQGAVDRIRALGNDAAQRNKDPSSHVTINTKPAVETSRLYDRGRSSLAPSVHQSSKDYGAADHIGSSLINSSDDVSAYDTSFLHTNNRPLSETQSFLNRIDRATSADRLSISRKTEEYRPAPRRTPSPSIHSSYSQDPSRAERNDRGSSRPASSRANRPLLAVNSNLFGGPRDEDLRHQPIINGCDHPARDRTRPKPSSSILQPPMRFK